MGLITLTDADQDAVPAWFAAALKRQDPSLMVGRWHPAPPVLAEHPELQGKWRWCIYQCTRHQSATGEHTEACLRAGTYVLLVQSPEGDWMPLNDRVLERLREIDVVRQGLSLDERGLERWRRERAYEQQQAAAKREREAAEIVRLNSRDHRRQLLRAHHLIQQHDLRINQ